MSSSDGRDGLDSDASQAKRAGFGQSVECQLFESLVHHLIEKGVLTKKDALSVVETVVEARGGAGEEATGPSSAMAEDVRWLERLHSSLEALSEPRRRPPAREDNVHQIRPLMDGHRGPRDD